MTHVFRCLVTKFKEAGKKPVNYFKFVLNPDCFGTSIENMFHVSFLVKEGKADISVCGETGLPFITPKSKKKDEEEEKKNQVVMNIYRRGEYSLTNFVGSCFHSISIECT